MRRLPILLCVSILALAALACGGSATLTPTAPPARASPTPVDSSPASPGRTSPEAGYADAVLRISTNYRDAFTTIGEQFTNAGNDTSLLLDDEWKVTVAAALAVLQISGNDLRALVPPAKFAGAHKEFLGAADHFDQVAILAAEGIDNLDGAKLSQAVQEMNLGNAAIRRATDQALQATTITPIAAPEQSPRANTGANLRAGPGTNYAIVGKAAQGQPLAIVARNPAGDWYQLASGAWIFGELVTGAPVVPMVTVNAATTAATVPAVPAASRGSAFTCIGGCAVAPDPSCAIKGNVNSSEEKIYHTPGGAYYDRTDIKPEEGDRWFCTETEAEAAGCRPSDR